MTASRRMNAGLNIRIQRSLRERFKQRCQIRGERHADVIRRAIEDYLAQPVPKGAVDGRRRVWIIQ